MIVSYASYTLVFGTTLIADFAINTFYRSKIIFPFLQVRQTRSPLTFTSVWELFCLCLHSWSSLSCTSSSLSVSLFCYLYNLLPYHVHLLPYLRLYSVIFMIYYHIMYIFLLICDYILFICLIYYFIMYIFFLICEFILFILMIYYLIMYIFFLI